MGGDTTRMSLFGKVNNPNINDDPTTHDDHDVIEEKAHIGKSNPYLDLSAEKGPT
jgi:hypothetical protein